MRILLLNQAFYPDVASTAQHASDLAVRLVEHGHDVTVVCGRRAYDNPSERYSARETWRRVNIRRISNFGFGKRARWRRAADFGSYLANCILHLALLPRYDVVIAMTSPPLISSLGALFTAVKGGRFVFWVMDLNPDEALAAGWLRAGSWTTTFLNATLEYGLRRATAVIALDRFMAARIAAKGVPTERIATLPPWSHDDAIQYDAEGRNRFRRESGLAEKFVVMYSGNHSPCHPLTTLLDAAFDLRHEGKITFCFVGGGSEMKTVQHFARSRGLDNIVTLSYQPLDKLSASLSAADMHVVVMGDPFVGIVHPCKVYNIRTLGIPYLYIGPAASHVADLTPTFSVRHDDVQALVRYIRSAAAGRWPREFHWKRSAPDVTVHGQEPLLRQMVSLIEGAVTSSAQLSSDIARVAS